MIRSKALIDYANQILMQNAIKDYAPNGLQIEGAEQVDAIYTAVNASKDVLERVVGLGGRFLLVHHGYFWKGEKSILQGYMRDRLACCLQHNINLCAYHLPLDDHEVYGNNAQLAHVMGWQIKGRLPSTAGIDLGMWGQPDNPCTVASLAHDLEKKLGYCPQVITLDKTKRLNRIAWCTGAAYDDIHFAIEAGIDAFITGEIAERTVHIARETGITFYAAGHYATEQFGVQALGSHLAEKFEISHTFISSDVPV